MIVIVDHRPDVCEAFANGFRREGHTAVPFLPQDVLGWLQTTSEADLCAVEAVLLGDCESREIIAQRLRKSCNMPVIALSDSGGLDNTLKLFNAGVDDVVRKPVHVREILARMAAIRRREAGCREALWNDGGLVIYGDGRDIQIAGQIVQIPRRELRILEYLAITKSRRVTRAQIFNAVYGMLDEDVEESVVESHISKLRKKLKSFLGYDPIDTQRFLGYQLVGGQPAMLAA
jgi:two-component system, OmpR family, flagellar system response regulator FtcR